jgi:hypothetical protein
MKENKRQNLMKIETRVDEINVLRDENQVLLDSKQAKTKK